MVTRICPAEEACLCEPTPRHAVNVVIKGRHANELRGRWMKRERENGARELPSGVGVTALVRVMTIARRLFRNTWVQRLAITSNLYRALLWLGFRSRVYEITFSGTLLPRA